MKGRNHQSDPSKEKVERQKLSPATKQITTAKMSDQIGGFGVRAMKPRKGKKPLTINLPPKPEATPTNDDLDGKQQLEIGIEYNLNLNKEDLEMIKELGSGNGGTVSKVKHRATGTVMARKVRRSLAPT